MINIIARYKVSNAVFVFQNVTSFTEVAVGGVDYYRISIADQTIDLDKTKYQIIETGIGS